MTACTSLCRSKPGGTQAVSWGSGYYLLSPTKNLSPIGIPLQRKNQCSTIESHWVYKAHFWVGPWPQSKLNGNFGNVLSHIFGLYLSLETFGLYILVPILCFYGFSFVFTPFGVINSKLWLLLEVFGDFTMICICVSSCAWLLSVWHLHFLLATAHGCPAHFSWELLFSSVES